MSEAVADRYRTLRRAIEDELHKLGRDPAAVTLVGVAKGQSPERVAEGIRAGLTDVAANYVQEALRIFPSLPPARKHFIGHLQTNKAKAIAASFDVVQSVDRVQAGLALSKAAVERAVPLPVLLQLNVTRSERFGCPPGQAPRLAETLRGLPGLQLLGVMAMAPFGGDRDEILQSFELAAKTLERIGGSTLSIGMSGDWREALRAGSTMLRIGEALFGPRTDGRHA